MVTTIAFQPFQGETGLGSFLSSYAKSQEIAQQKQAAERQKVLAGRQDEQYAREKQMQAIDALGGALDGVQDEAGFEQVKQWAVSNKLLDPAEAGRYTFANLPQIRALSQQARAQIKQRQDAEMAAKKFDLDRRSTEANIRQSDASADAARANAEYIRSGKAAPGGRNLTTVQTKEFSGLGDQYNQVKNFNASFKDEYANRGFYGIGADAQNFVDRQFGGSDAATWWQGYDKYKNVVRNELFGAALTPSEQAAFEKADIYPGMGAKSIRANLKIQHDVLRAAITRRSRGAAAQGYNATAIEELTGLGGQDSGPSEPQATQQVPDWAR